MSSIDSALRVDLKFQRRIVQGMFPDDDPASLSLEAVFICELCVGAVFALPGDVSQSQCRLIIDISTTDTLTNVTLQYAMIRLYDDKIKEDYGPFPLSGMVSEADRLVWTVTRLY